jgi:hypothetical protein
MNRAGFPKESAAWPGRADDALRADEIIEAIAKRIVARRLEGPAVLFLELHKPLAFILSQAALVATPMLGLFASPQEIEDFSRILGSRQAVEALIQRIEALSAQQRERQAQ